MANPEVEAATVRHEVYRDRPILFMQDGTGAVLYAMEEYLGGNGAQPAIGDEVVLSVLGPQGQTSVGGKLVDQPRQVQLEGVFRVVDVKDGDIKSPFFTKQPGTEGSFWGLDITRVRDITTGEEIDRIEKACLISMI